MSFGAAELSAVLEEHLPPDATGLVGELRARDWIAANGEVTVVGRNALSRWLENANSR